MSKKDFQTRSLIPSIHGFEEREARRARRYSPEGEEIMGVDEDGYIPTPNIKTVTSVKVYYFTAEDPGKKHLFGSFKNINEAQDKMREAHGGGPVYGRMFRGVLLDHWLLHWTDQDHENHYQKYLPDFSNVFCYDDKYAHACHHPDPETGEERTFAYKVDPPIGEIPDAEP